MEVLLQCEWSYSSVTAWYVHPAVTDSICIHVIYDVFVEGSPSTFRKEVIFVELASSVNEGRFTEKNVEFVNL